MLRARILTAMAALAVLFGAFLFGNLTFMRFFFTFLVGVTAWEILSMLAPIAFQKAKVPVWFKPVAVASIGILFALSIYHEGQRSWDTLLVGTLLGFTSAILLARIPEQIIGLASSILICIVYAGFTWRIIWDLYRFAPDASLIFLLCAIVSTGDSVAYFVGKHLGRHKLDPLVSPNKTWEGAIGGLLASVAGAILMKLIYGDLNMNWPTLIFAGLFCGALGQLGDLLESALKRYAQVKDSGKILPGHGGFLDRIDGILIAAPGLWLILKI